MTNFVVGLLAGIMVLGAIPTPTTSIEVETIYGIVLNEQGDGKIVVNADEEYNYISYKSVEDAEIGDCIKTICVNIDGECEYRYDTIVETCIDRYEGDDANEYCVFEIKDGENIIMGECYAWEYVDAINAKEFEDIHKVWNIGTGEYKDNSIREQMIQRKVDKLFNTSGQTR